MFIDSMAALPGPHVALVWRVIIASAMLEDRLCMLGPKSLAAPAFLSWTTAVVVLLWFFSPELLLLYRALSPFLDRQAQYCIPREMIV